MNNDPALQQMLQQRTQLPVGGYKSALLKAIRENQVVIVRGATGCGKTTQVCGTLEVLSQIMSSGVPLHHCKHLFTGLNLLRLKQIFKARQWK